MNHTEILTRYTANFVDEIVKNGLTDVIISPGSRSTPLAMTFTEHKDVNTWVIIDERSAAFFALGMAKQKRQPVVLLCTSGTAAANYFPAIVEAHYSRVPLVVLTADRPHELRDVGAPQAIEQIKLYGDYVKWFQEMALPEASPNMLAYVRSKAARAVYLAAEGNAGPVHLNFPFREPLVPDFTIENLWGEQDNQNHSYHAITAGTKELSDDQLEQLVDQLKNKKRGLIVCGPQIEKEFAQAISSLAFEWGLPILADPLSQVRSGKHFKDYVIEGYDAILRNESVREQLKPDFIIRFGAMPVSKAYLFYVKKHHDAMQFVVESNQGYREPAGNETAFIFADPNLLCGDLIDVAGGMDFDRDWLEKWREMNIIAKEELLNDAASARLTEGGAVRGLMEVIPQESSLYVGNSMAVRDLDTFFMTTSKELTILANRGANGIDGMISSGLGAAASGQSVTLLLGDLSFFHDSNGLLAAKHYDLNMTILLINNNGGGIFSFLSQADEGKHFEALFGTPAGIEFKKLIETYGGHYASVSKEEELQDVLSRSYTQKGLSVIEVKTDRAENAEWHRQKWKNIEKEIEKRVW